VNSLRVIASVTVAFFIMTYILFFLTTVWKKRRFAAAFSSVGLLLGLIVRRQASATNNDSLTTTDSLRWLDEMIFFALIAGLAGMINAETTLISSILSTTEQDMELASSGDEEEAVGDGVNLGRGESSALDEQQRLGRPQTLGTGHVGNATSSHLITGDLADARIGGERS
jgi:hypothetical protein